MRPGGAGAPAVRVGAGGRRGAGWWSGPLNWPPGGSGGGSCSGESRVVSHSCPGAAPRICENGSSSSTPRALPAPTTTERWRSARDAGRRERDFAYSSGLPPSARRRPGRGGGGRDDVPRRYLVHERRLHGRRRVLRPLGVPDHVAPGGRVAPEPDYQAGVVLGPPGPSPVAGAAADAALRRVLRLGDRARGHVWRAAARCALDPALREQLALHPGRVELLQRDGLGLTADPHLVARGGGAVLSDLAAGRAGRAALHQEPQGAPRRVRRGRRGLGDRDVRALQPRPTSTGSTSAPTPAPSASSSAAPWPWRWSSSPSDTTSRVGWPPGSCGARSRSWAVPSAPWPASSARSGRS